MKAKWDTIVKLRRAFRKTPVPYCAAVVLAAGSSTRMGSDKILGKLCELPVLARTLMPFQASDCVHEIVVVTAADKLQEITELCRDYNIGKVSKVVIGGKTRAESALTGVSEVSSKAELIAIHDGARPLVTEDLIRRTVELADRKYAAVPAIRSTDTLKKVGEDGVILCGVDREETWRIQTPQVFQADLIKAALTRAMKKGVPLTDDGSAMSLLGYDTYVTEGDEENIKLTKPLDLLLAEAIIKDRRERRADRSGL